MDKPSDLIVAKKVFLALVEFLGMRGVEMLDSLGRKQWWKDMKIKSKNMENMTNLHTGLGLVEQVVERLTAHLVAPVWQMMSNQKRSEALTQLSKPRDCEEMLKR